MRNSTDFAFNRYRPAAYLRMSGSDVATFLQGQFTADLRSVDSSDATYGLWLNQKGKVVADSFITRAGQDFLLASYSSTAEAIVGRLEPYIVADDVVISDETADVAGIALFGSEPAWGELLAEDDGPTKIFSGRRGEGRTRELFCAPEMADRLASRALGRGAREMAAAEMEWKRIAAGIPTIPCDIGPGDLPQEGGLERDAVAFEKGCYLGQEIMARLHSGGQVRRRLRRVLGRGELPANFPAPLYREGRSVGELRSAANANEAGKFIGLAMLMEFLLGPKPESAELAFTADGPAAVTVGAGT